jgi:diaminohydroxyphosphoribosylaminopyrimidine deaminase/5-amino-6-(5-phosphoribosylamino)uracil reductase
MILTDETYMERCLSLASQGAGWVAPNPMVGAVLVHEGRIIGEGYHERYGQAHAEPNCINSVAESDKPLIPHATLYVSLEPCAHFGKTPPCADLIVRQKIPKVVIGCRDPFEQVNGRGIEKLRAAGVEVVVGVCEPACIDLNKRFFRFHQQHRPYVVLKWAQTADRKIAGLNEQRLLISQPETNRLVHKWRSEEAAILVGTETALRDDPSLDNRLWTGNNPVRLVIDLSLRLPSSLKLFNREQPTVVFNLLKEEKDGNLHFLQLKQGNIVQQILAACYQMNLQSILVEGGAKTLQSFINANAWDEARVITNTSLHIGEGLNAPCLNGQQISYSEKLVADTIDHYNNQSLN